MSLIVPDVPAHQHSQSTRTPRRRSSRAEPGAPGGVEGSAFAFSFRRTHLSTHTLYLSEDAQNISAENLLDVLRLVSTIQQSLRDLRQVGGRVDFLRKHRHTVEVRTKSDVIDASDLRDVVDMIDQRFQRRPRDLGS